MEKLVKNETVADQEIDVLCEPLAGKAPETVAQWLTDLGARRIQFLAGRFISARIHRKDIALLSKIARVSEKKLHHPNLMPG